MRLLKLAAHLSPSLTRSQLSDAYADAQIEVDGTNGCLNALTNLKQQYPLLKVILSVGGGGPGSAPFAEVASSGTTRNTFAMSARALIDEYGLDGIDSTPVVPYPQSCTVTDASS